MKTNYKKTRRAIYKLTVHIIFVTKYRRKVLTKEMLEELHLTCDSVAKKWTSEVVEFNGESDHIHLLLSYPPHKLLSDLIANLKSSSSRRIWNTFPEEMERFYSKRVLWTGSYFVASCGEVTIEQFKKYVQQQDAPC